MNFISKLLLKANVYNIKMRQAIESKKLYSIYMYWIFGWNEIQNITMLLTREKQPKQSGKKMFCQTV